MPTVGAHNLVFLVGVAVSILAFIFQIIGLATTEWTTFDNTVLGISVKVEYGLFRVCDSDTCVDYGDNVDEPSEVKATQAMEIIGMVMICIALILGVVHIVLTQLTKAIRMMPLGAAISAFAACVFVIIGVIVWGAKVHEDILDGEGDIGYSLAMSVLAGILSLVSGILYIVGRE